jgi:RNA recognition motif-containing protein
MSSGGKGITVYIGKIASSVDDGFVRLLLEQCGRILSWNRPEDASTGQKKSFGFCQFALPQDALRAIKLLNGIQIDQSPLLVKVDKNTQEVLDSFEQNFKASLGRDPGVYRSIQETGEREDQQKVLVLAKLIQDRSRRMSESSSGRKSSRSSDKVSAVLSKKESDLAPAQKSQIMAPIKKESVKKIGRSLGKPGKLAFSLGGKSKKSVKKEDLDEEDSNEAEIYTPNDFGDLNQAEIAKPSVLDTTVPWKLINTVSCCLTAF